MTERALFPLENSDGQMIVKASNVLSCVSFKDARNKSPREDFFNQNFCWWAKRQFYQNQNVLNMVVTVEFENKHSSAIPQRIARKSWLVSRMVTAQCHIAT